MTANSYLPPDYIPMGPYTVYALRRDGLERSLQLDTLPAAVLVMQGLVPLSTEARLIDGRGEVVSLFGQGQADAVDAVFDAMREAAAPRHLKLIEKFEWAVRERRAYADHIRGAP